MENLSDAELGDRVAAQVAVPRVDPADSFVLHAPLELLARTALLPLVSPEVRPAARRRIFWLGETYAAIGRGFESGSTVQLSTTGEALARLLAAIEAGDLEAVDAPADWLASRLTAEELAGALADEVIPRLPAAAHGPIFLHQLVRVAPRSTTYARALRGLVREIAREHDWRFQWHRERRPEGPVTDDLVERLLDPPSPGDPGSHFIYPMMSLVERSGLALERLDAPTRALDPARASRLLARVAAWSMLQDDPGQAPYGWTHCLSMPQAVLGIAGACRDPRTAVAVAATHVLGFRSVLGRVKLDPRWRPETPSVADPVEALGGSPAEAAAGVWHASREDQSRLVGALASRAAIHPDAHLAKYTVACLDAARADPEEQHLYLAAAAYLSAWWREQDESGTAPEN